MRQVGLMWFSAALVVLAATPTYSLFANHSGDLVLGALFPVHGFIDDQCGSIQEQDGIQMLEAMLYTIDLINHQSILPGFTLGVVGLDSCDSDTIALDQAVEFVKVLVSKVSSTHEIPYTCADGSKAKLRQGGIDFHRVIGVVGGSSSTVTIQVANLLRLFKVPQISYLSTSPDLSNTDRFDYFQRTVPSDTSQAKAILEIIKLFNWTYVSAVYEDSNYGLKGFGELERLSDEARICFAVQEKIQLDQNLNDAYYDAIVRQLLQKSKAKGVIIFADFGRVRSLFEAVNRSSDRRVHDFFWIGSDGWSGRQSVVDGLEHIVDGAITVQPLAIDLPEFTDYFKRLRPATNKRNPWFQEFWEKHFSCSFSDKFPRPCTGNETFDREGSDYIVNQYAHFVKDAVLAFAYALRNMHRNVCGENFIGLCAEMEPEKLKGDQLLKHIKEVNFTDPETGQNVYFLNGVDAPARYSFLQYRRATSTSNYKWDKIGSYIDQEGVPVLDFLDAFESRMVTYPDSTCSEPCQLGDAMVFVQENKCCWYCQNCTDNQYLPTLDKCEDCPQGTWPSEYRNICTVIPEEYLTLESQWAIGAYTFSSLGMVITIIVSVLFFVYSYTPVIKASGREVSSILLVGIFLSYAVTFPFVSKPSPATCGMIRFLLGFCYTVCYAAILTKTNRISRIFNQMNGSSATKTKYTDPKSQMIITGAIVLIQLVILAVWLIVAPPDTTHIYPTAEVSILICTEAVGFSYLIALSYPFCLIVACTVYAIKTRKTPDGFNETQFIAFSNYTTCVLWLAFVSLYFASSSYYIRTITLSLSVALSATVQLVCLFIPKLYICIFRPHKNTRDAVMSKTRSGSHLHSGCHSNNSGLNSNKQTPVAVMTDNQSSGISAGYSFPNLPQNNFLSATNVSYVLDCDESHNANSDNNTTDYYPQAVSTDELHIETTDNNIVVYSSTPRDVSYLVNGYGSSPDLFPDSVATDISILSTAARPSSLAQLRVQADIETQHMSGSPDSGYNVEQYKTDNAVYL